MYSDPSIWFHLGKVRHMKPIAETPNCHQLPDQRQGQCQRVKGWLSSFILIQNPHMTVSGPQHRHSHQSIGECLREVSLGHCFPRKYTAELRAGNLLGGTPQLEWMMARLHGPQQNGWKMRLRVQNVLKNVDRNWDFHMADGNAVSRKQSKNVSIHWQSPVT